MQAIIDHETTYKIQNKFVFCRIFSIHDRMELKRKLHCKPFNWYLKNVYPELILPASDGGPGGSLKQGTACLDSMGHLLDGNVSLYPCHDTGGNQASSFQNRN
jgi:hypothetical protein